MAVSFEVEDGEVDALARHRLDKVGAGRVVTADEVCGLEVKVETPIPLARLYHWRVKVVN